MQRNSCPRSWGPTLTETLQPSLTAWKPLVHWLTERPHFLILYNDRKILWEDTLHGVKLDGTSWSENDKMDVLWKFSSQLNVHLVLALTKLLCHKEFYKFYNMLCQQFVHVKMSRAINTWTCQLSSVQLSMKASSAAFPLLGWRWTIIV